MTTEEIAIIIEFILKADKMEEVQHYHDHSGCGKEDNLRYHAARNKLSSILNSHGISEIKEMVPCAGKLVMSIWGEE